MVCQKFMVTLVRWFWLRGSTKYIHSSNIKLLFLTHPRGWVLCNTDYFHLINTISVKLIPSYTYVGADALGACILESYTSGCSCKHTHSYQYLGKQPQHGSTPRNTKQVYIATCCVECMYQIIHIPTVASFLNPSLTTSVRH